jgi:hypothetical protein
MVLTSKGANMYYSQGHKLLSRESWKWIGLNDNKQINESHNLLCIIKEIDSPGGELNNLINDWQELIGEYQLEYEEISLEEVSFHRGCGEFDHKWYIVGARKETPKEVELRLEEINRQAERKAAEELAQVKIKEEQEYQNFLKLQEKFKNK